MKLFIRPILVALFFVISCGAWGQNSLHSGYFLDGMLNRHELNPAIQNRTGYIGIPVLGNFNVGIHSNMGAADFLYPMANGQLTTFMSSAVSSADFLDNIKRRNTMQADIEIGLLSAGFWSWGGYNTIAITMHSQSGSYVPYEMFDFMKSGMSSPQGSAYNIKNFSFNTNNYVDLALGHSRRINDQWTVGAKLKLIVGAANIDARISNMDATLSGDQWLINMQGEIQGSAPGILFATDDEGQISGAEFRDFDPQGLGWGLGVDLGATYKPIEDLTISLAVTDLGFISWGNTIRGTNPTKEFVFDGFSDIPVGGDQGVPIDEQFEDVKNQFQELMKFYPSGCTAKRTTMLRANVNVGVEYFLVPEKFSFGLLWSTRFDRDFIRTEALLSANYRPAKWFNMALTGGVSNISTSWGWVINFCPRAINFYVGADYMLTKISPQWVPLNNANTVVSFGLNVPIQARRNHNKGANSSQWTDWLCDD